MVKISLLTHSIKNSKILPYQLSSNIRRILSGYMKTEERNLAVIYDFLTPAAPNWTPLSSTCRTTTRLAVGRRMNFMYFKGGSGRRSNIQILGADRLSGDSDP